MKYLTLECEHCNKVVKAEEATGWTSVHQLVGSETELARLQMRGVQSLDAGDFCSLLCLASWASLQATSHEMDAELDLPEVTDQ